MRNDRAKQRKTIIYLAIFAIVVMAAITVVVLTQLPPPGKDIIGKPLPEDHETDSCYRCHRGIPAWPGIADHEKPDEHATADCMNCHQGYAEPSA